MVKLRYRCKNMSHKMVLLETMSRPLRLQSSPVRVLSSNVLPDGQSDIDFSQKFFDTCCWSEGGHCALSKHRMVVSCCLIERRVRQRKVEHEHEAVLPGTSLAALPQPRRRRLSVALRDAALCSGASNALNATERGGVCSRE